MSINCKQRLDVTLYNYDVPCLKKVQ